VWYLIVVEASVANVVATASLGQRVDLDELGRLWRVFMILIFMVGALPISGLLRLGGRFYLRFWEDDKRRDEKRGRSYP